MDLETLQTEIQCARQCAQVLAAAGRLPVSTRDAAKIRQQLVRHLTRALAEVNGTAAAPAQEVA